MYMAPVTRSRPASSVITRRLVGAPMLFVSVAVMLPWLAVNAAISGIVVGVLMLGPGPRVLLQAIDYAGEDALGR